MNRYRYSELWALLFSKLKKPVNLTENLTVCEFRVSLESPHRRKVQPRVLESAIIFLVFIFGRSYWFNKSFIDANYKVLKVLFFCYLYSWPVFSCGLLSKDNRFHHADERIFILFTTSPSIDDNTQFLSAIASDTFPWFLKVKQCLKPKTVLSVFLFLFYVFSFSLVL